jgi:hypothetical protein
VTACFIFSSKGEHILILIILINTIFFFFLFHDTRFELQTCEKNHKSLLTKLTQEYESEISDLKQRVFDLTLECKEARESSLRESENAEIDFKEAADEIISVYESKLQVCAENVASLQKKVDELHTSKQASVYMLEEKCQELELKHATELKKEKEKVAKEQAAMKNYVEFVKNKYKQV